MLFFPRHDTFRVSLLYVLYAVRFPSPFRLDSGVVAMDSDGCCTIVGCRDGSLRMLDSHDGRGFAQASFPSGSQQIFRSFVMLTDLWPKLFCFEHHR